MNNGLYMSTYTLHYSQSKLVHTKSLHHPTKENVTLVKCAGAGRELLQTRVRALRRGEVFLHTLEFTPLETKFTPPNGKNRNTLDYSRKASSSPQCV
jgi:hypothetical protein